MQLNFTAHIISHSTRFDMLNVNIATISNGNEFLLNLLYLLYAIYTNIIYTNNIY